MSLLNFREWGDVNKKPVLLLHGLLGELQNWNSQAKYLAEDHYVISVDMRNHGASPHLPGMSYAQMANDLLVLINHLDLVTINLVGHSMGGKAAMLFSLLQYERVDKLIVVDIAPVKYPIWHRDILLAMLSLPLETIKSRRQADDLLAASVKSAFERGFLLKNLARNTTGYYWKCDLKEITSQYLKIASFPLLDRSYKAPAWFIKGAESDYITDENKTTIQQYFPKAHIQSIVDAGHLPHVQQPKVFYQLVVDILAT